MVGEGREGTFAHENPNSLVLLKNKANLTFPEVLLLEASSARGSIGESVVFGLVSSCTFWVRARYEHPLFIISVHFTVVQLIQVGDSVAFGLVSCCTFRVRAKI